LHKQNENMDPLCLVTTWHTLGHRFKCHGLPEHCFWPYPSLLRPPCTHPLMATSSRIMHHVTKLESFQIDFLNMKMSSLY